MWQLDRFKYNPIPGRQAGWTGSFLSLISRRSSLVVTLFVCALPLQIEYEIFPDIFNDPSPM
jgi:hypothetical protein